MQPIRQAQGAPMFDGVGRNRDEEATKRSAQSLVATTLLGFVGTCVAGAVIVATAVPPVDSSAVEDYSDVVEFVIQQQEPEALQLPAPPRAIKRAAPDIETEVAPVEPDVEREITPLTEVVDPVVAEAGGGSPDGDIDGDPTSTHVGTPGTGTTDCGEDCGGPPTGGPMAIHWTEVQAKRRVAPEYPDQARDMDLGEVSCKVLMTIDERGRTTGVQMKSCPAVFHKSAEQALMKWTFYPAKAGGKSVPAQFLLSIRYKLR